MGCAGPKLRRPAVEQDWEQGAAAGFAGPGGGLAAGQPRTRRPTAFQELLPTRSDHEARCQPVPLLARGLIVRSSRPL